MKIWKKKKQYDYTETVLKQYVIKKYDCIFA